MAFICVCRSIIFWANWIRSHLTSDWIKVNLTITFPATIFFFVGFRSDSGSLPPLQGFAITLRHTTFGRNPWTSDQPDAETSTWKHTTLSTDRHPCPWWDSNPQSQKASGLRQCIHWERLTVTIMFREWFLSSILYSKSARYKLFVHFAQYCAGEKTKKNEIGWACGAYGWGEGGGV
jgi:hypothetical protein